MHDRSKKTKIIYTGDVLAGSFYLFIGVIAIISSIILAVLTERLGFYYLSIGMFIFSLYMLGKGGIMMYMYYSRYQYYKTKLDLTVEDLKDEQTYTRWRIMKKKKNRRKYLYVVLIGSLLAFMGLFHQEKGLIIATCIPIVLLSAIEFSVGLLTEFRLSTYMRHLKKMN